MENFFIVILISQMLSYGIIDHFKIKYGRLIILSIFLSLFLIVFPIYYQAPKNCFCGCYSLFDYFQDYWTIGIITVLSAHLIYCYLINRKQKTVKQ